MNADRIKIGMDFDNTVIIYDDVFHKYGVQLGLIDPGVKKNKQTIRDAIRKLPDGESEWIKLQGLVYGLYIDEAAPAEGVEDFLDVCKAKGVEVSIISHKTQYPALGPKYDMPKAAKGWLEHRKFSSRFGISPEDVIFERSLKGKFDKITQRDCTHFIDDLPEVLLDPHFPQGVVRILYSQIKENASEKYLHFNAWHEIKKYFFKK